LSTLDPNVIRASVRALDEARAASRLEVLVPELIEHNRRYHIENAATIDDRTYDLLYRELELIEERFPALVRADSPTNRVGDVPVAELTPFEHRTPMLSLANAFSAEELGEFDQRLKRFLGDDAPETITYVVEAKLDGLAIELVYEHGKLTGAGTRGDGQTGEDVLHNIRTIRAIPEVLLGDDLPDRISVRGEIFFGLEGFDRMNVDRVAQGIKAFENPRNAAAGTVRQLDPRVAAGRPLTFFAHSIGEVEGAQLPDSHTGQLEVVSTWGVLINDELNKRVEGIEAVVASHGLHGGQSPTSTRLPGFKRCSKMSGSRWVAPAP
jgi:DNA ligase (NAD+)